MPERKLVSIELAGPTKVWNRVIVTYTPPSEEDLQYYYNTLLGIQNLTITLRIEDIPDEFNERLLTIHEDVPKTFPAHDLETTIDNTAQRKKYHDFLNQLCMMERNRVDLRVFAKPSTIVSPIMSTPHESASLLKSRVWVNELLKALKSDYDFEEPESTEIVFATFETTPPVGWIFTPSNAQAREELGSRIIVSTTIGQKWEQLLGTDLYPDLVVSRRITTNNWSFQHPTSNALLQSLMDWYIASKGIEVNDGVSEWVKEADREFNVLLASFWRVKVQAPMDIPESMLSAQQSEAYKLLNTMEDRLLTSVSEDPTIAPLDANLFQRYCTYMFRALKIDRSTYHGNGAITQKYERWERSRYGFRHDRAPFVDGWCEMWNLIHRGNHVTKERVTLFVYTLDSWDSLESLSLSPAVKGFVSTEWVRIFVDHELVFDEKAKVRSLQLHSNIKEFCLKYLPEMIYPSQFTPMAIGPILTSKYSLASTRTRDGRFTRGVKYKRPEMEKEVVGGDVAKVKSTQYENIITETADDNMSERRTITKTVTADNGSTRIEHYFSASVTTQEIHLGSL